MTWWHSMRISEKTVSKKSYYILAFFLNISEIDP